MTMKPPSSDIIIPASKIKKIASHRNGVAGNPFYIVLFDEGRGNKKQSMIAVVFEGSANHVAVFDADLLLDNVIEFGYNSWRGDMYENSLREHIKNWDVNGGKLK